ncbi:MAG: SMC-Scp complex subunit ScpB [Clostridiales bacterium]|nr:SMC-Scp complex subunit ScpB [Clostridiales bacterium]
MEIKKLREAIKAILFVSGDPVSIDRVADALELDRPTAAKILQNLADEYDGEESGVLIVRMEDQYQMCSNPKYAKPIHKVMDMRRNTPLSPAGLEVLAIVAYNQPVTKAFIEQIRGVDCSGVIGSLSAKGLIEERGRLELPGRPLLYGTTANFLRCLSISSLSELPPIPEKQAEEEKADA